MPAFNPATTVLQITDNLAIDEQRLVWRFIRASGPGGQNVNKVATAAQLRFDARAAGLPPEVFERLRRLAGRKMTDDGVLVITARRFRSQEKNRQDALNRLVALLRRASVAPKPRKKTRPPREWHEKRLQAKHRRAEIKQLRRTHPLADAD